MLTDVVGIFSYRITNVFLLLLSKIDETSLVHGSTNFIIISKYNEGLVSSNAPT